MRLALFLAAICLASVLDGQSNSQFHLEVEDTARVILNSRKGENSDLETWVSGVNFRSYFDDTFLGWSMVADGKDASFRIETINQNKPSMVFNADGKLGFGTLTPSEDYEFVGSTFRDLLRIRSGNLLGLSIESGLISHIINKDPGELTFKILDQEIAKIDAIGRFVSEKRIVSKERLVMGNGTNIRWDLFIGASGCGADGNDLAFSRNFSLKTVIDSETGDMCSVSDRRFKKNIEALRNVKEKVMRLKPYSFRYKTQESEAKKSIGLMAQDLLPFFPEMVRHDEAKDQYSVAYQGVDIVLVAALQERQKELQEYQDRIKHLEDAIEKLGAKNH